MGAEITIAEAQELVLRPAYELARVQFMGWRFGKPSISEDGPFGFRLRVAFTCVCGRQELFSYIAHHLADFRHVEVARQLTQHGSFSREHLLADGYTEAQVREIERKGEEFDRVTRQHWEMQILAAGGFDEFRFQQMRSANAR